MIQLFTPQYVKQIGKKRGSELGTPVLLVVISYDASIIRSNFYANDLTSLMTLVTYSYVVIIRIHLSYN